MSEDRWLETLELEAVLRMPRAIAELMEKNRLLTAAQGTQMIRQWQLNLHADLEMYNFPKSGKLRHRSRDPLPDRPRDQCCPGTQQFQDVVYDQIEDRWAKRMPSKTRMIQIYMSKQVPIEDIMPQEWVPTARAFYLRALRKAHKLQVKKGLAKSSPKAGVPMGSKPKKLKRGKQVPIKNLFAAPAEGSPTNVGDGQGDDDALRCSCR